MQTVNTKHPHTVAYIVISFRKSDWNLRMELRVEIFGGKLVMFLHVQEYSIIYDSIISLVTPRLGDENGR